MITYFEPLTSVDVNVSYSDAFAIDTNVLTDYEVSWE